MNAFEAVTSSVWAIRPEWLQAIAEVSAREPLTSEQFRERIEAVRARAGKPVEETRRLSQRGNVAILATHGPIFRRANFFADISGASSISSMATDLQAAIDNPDVASIVLEVDSPGGEVAGVGEFADMVRNSPKPVHAYIDGLGCSAAYWIASAARTITAAPTAMVGSIGVVSTHKKDDAKSARSIEIVSSRSPNKRPDLGTEKGRATVQKTVDGIADIFIGTVAANRGVSAEDVVAKFGAGGVLLGGEAESVGMVDRVGTFESLIESLNRGVHPERRPAPTQEKKAVADDTTQAAAPAATAEQIADLQRANAEMRAQLEAVQAREAAQRRGAILADADRFVEEQVRAGRILPALKGQAKVMLATSEMHEAGIKGHAAAIDKDGKLVAVENKGESFTLSGPGFREFLAAMPARDLSAEYVRARDVTLLSNDGDSAAESEHDREIAAAVKASVVGK